MFKKPVINEDYDIWNKEYTRRNQQLIRWSIESNQWIREQDNN